MSTFQDLLFPPTEKIDDKEETVKWEDWNERFQNALNMPQRTLEERITRFDAMNTINEDFKCVRIFFLLANSHTHLFIHKIKKIYFKHSLQTVYVHIDITQVATDCSRAIVDEMFIRESEKTIFPKMLNGIAGGVKFIMRGILFKVANGSIGPYGGDDEAAMKTYGNELRNVSHFLCSSLNVEHKINIHVALQGVVEYKGFRILAQAKLPVNDESLRIGTATGKVQDLRISKVDKDLIQAWKDIGMDLHLASHICGDHVLYVL